MAEFNDSPTTSSNLVWQRLATPRETMFGLRTDGTIRSICSKLEILSSVKLDLKVLEECAEYFNRDMRCFNEFLMEKEGSRDIWLVETKKNCFMIEELENENEMDSLTIEDEINCRLRAEDLPSWKLYCSYIGFNSSESDDSEKYPHAYKLIFVFNTGTLDEFSCALVCDLFLNILDCALKNVPFQSYSDLNMYDVGSKLEFNINHVINEMQENKSLYIREDRIYRRKLRAACSTFNFAKRKFENRESAFRTKICSFSRDSTEEFLSICGEKNLGIYAVFIAIINNVLFHHAMKRGFEGIFRTRVLHIINARFIINLEDRKYSYKLGSHFLPYMQHFKLESIDIEEIFKEAAGYENQLDRITSSQLFWDQEAIRELIIKESGNKYNSGNWNPHYCFSVTNLGNLDIFYSPDSPKNSIRVLSYERASSALEGGHLDVIFHVIKNKLIVHFDFSDECFNENEMLSITKLFSDLVETIVFKI